MALEDTLRVLNAMQADGVIHDYAIGGAVAAFLYIEPGMTFDLDVFIAWEPQASGLLDFGPIYHYLLGKNYIARGETIAVEGWDVQFLPSGTPLVEEARQLAQPMEIGGVPTRVFLQEHLMAICLQTGRPKDFARLVQFVQEGDFDENKFLAILTQHELQEKWATFLKAFFNLP